MKTINLQPISENAKVISGFAFKSSEFMDIGIPVVKITNVKKVSVTLEDCQFVDRKYLSLNEKYKIKNGDVLIALTGSQLSQPNSVVGRVARYHYEEMALLNQRVGKFIIHGKNNLDLIFLYYYLVQDKILYSLALNAKGSANQANISPSDVERILIPAFNLSSQRVIADILSAYDDLIDTNRRRIQLLEEAARILFREWFVYFRFPGHEKVKIVDGVPEGWRFAKVKDLGQIVTGKTPSKKNIRNFDGNVPFIKTPDMHQSWIILNTEETLSEIGASLQNNKYLPPWSVLVSCIGTVGVVAMNLFKSQTNQQINSVIPKNKFYRYYSFFCLSNIKPFLEAIGGGSTMANINKNKFENIKINIPSENVLAKFYQTVNPIFNQIALLIDQNQKLAQARDLLLPRLMSGEIEV